MGGEIRAQGVLEHHLRVLDFTPSEREAVGGLEKSSDMARFCIKTIPLLFGRWASARLEAGKPSSEPRRGSQTV